MEKIMKFQELNKKYHEFLLEELGGERSIKIPELRKLAQEAEVTEIKLDGTDEEFLRSLRAYFRRLLKLS